MRIERHVVARKTQQLVALPAEVRRHLALVPGAKVYWHVVRKGHATLTASGRVRAGRTRFDADCSSCAKYRDELERLAGLLRSRSFPTYNEAVRDGHRMAMRYYSKIEADLGVVLDRLRAMESRLPAPRRRRVVAVHLPPASAPPPSEVVEGEAVAPGEPLPQGHP